MNALDDHDHDHGHHGHVHAPMSYAEQIAEQRAGKDAYFRQSPHSPIPPEQRQGFGGLAYYEVDAAMRFAPLALEPLLDGLAPETQVQTSDGAVREGRRAGLFRFRVGGIDQHLTALRLAGSSGATLFVPFTDATSGTATYGAGRYLDLEPLPDGRYDLDFNFAYAPFCAYSEHFSCPLPPAENRLSVAITAGERER